MNKCIILLSNFEHAVPSGTTDEDIVRATREHRLGDGFCCWLCHMNGKMDLPVPAPGEHLVVAFWPNNPYYARRAEQRGLAVEEYIDWASGEIQTRQREMGDRFIWCLGWETFSSPEWCDEAGNSPRFQTRQDGFAFYKRWITTSIHTRHWRHAHKFGDDRLNGRPCALEWLAQEKMPRTDFRLAVGGQNAPSHAHYAFEAVPELDTFWWECGIGVVNLQVGFAFVRGAARQYGRKWLADVSPFYYPYPLHPDEYYRELGEWGKTEEGVQGRCRLNFPKYTPERVRLAGYSDSLSLRCWLAAMMSGCDYLFEEASSLSHFVRVGERLELTPHGVAARRLADLNRRLPDRGKPLAPVALLLDFDHGLEPYASEKPWHFGESEEGDAQLFAFFNSVYPNHSQPPAPPWRNLREYGDLLRAGFDFRPYERRVLCNSEWADLFDVYLSNAPEKAFADSRLIVPLGRLSLTDAQQSQLVRLVEDGRDLVVAAGQLSQGSPLLAGLKPDAQASADLVERLGGTSSFSVSPGGEWQACAPSRVQAVAASGWDILLWNEAERPLLLKKRFGRGTVYFFTCRFGLDVNGRLHDRLMDLLRGLADGLLPFRVEGAPIQRILNRTNRGYLLTLINNGAEPWSGRICVGAERLPSPVEHWDNRLVAWEETPTGVSCSLDVPPFGIRILEVLDPAQTTCR